MISVRKGYKKRRVGERKISLLFRCQNNSPPSTSTRKLRSRAAEETLKTAPQSAVFYRGYAVTVGSKLTSTQHGQSSSAGQSGCRNVAPTRKKANSLVIW